MSNDFDIRLLTAERIAAAPTDAELSEHDGTWVLTVRRVLAHPPSEVWPMLTDPAQLVRWSPIVPDRVLDSAGPALSRESPDAEPVDVEVLQCRVPDELVHRWGSNVLRWRLRAVPDGTHLTLEQSFGDRTEAPLYGAGWQVCLGVLGLLDDGVDAPRVVGPESLQYGWERVRDQYAALFTPQP
ncbi:MAG: SRPBCC domain-containing protein [Nakamurella sp.]